jgi:hypothetical protein
MACKRSGVRIPVAPQVRRYMAGPPIRRGAKVGARRYARWYGKAWFGEDGIYFDHLAECQDGAHHKGCRGRWRGAISLGYGLDGKRLRRKVSGGR